MLTIIFGICAGLAFGWVSYAYRSHCVAAIVAMAGVGLVLMMAPVGPLLQVAATSHELTVMDVIVRLYAGLVPALLKDGWPWIAVFGVVGHVATAVLRKGFEPQPERPETRNARRRRIEAEMGFTDSYLD